MAKAIYGHTGIDARLAVEVSRLRSRVRELEAEVARLQAAAGEQALSDWILADDLLVPDPR
jgi:hypothetical protein